MGRKILTCFLLFCFHFSFGQITYQEHIAPLLESKCLSCHDSGKIGAMPLTSYDEVSSYATMIAYVTEQKLMPPFKADPTVADYTNDRSLSKEEIQLIKDWINLGMKKGDEFHHASKERVEIYHSDPDTSICMDESFEHYGIYYDQFQVFRIPFVNEEDKLISGIDVRPGNRKVVRSAALSIAEWGSGEKKDQWDPRYGYFAFGHPGLYPNLPLIHFWQADSSPRKLSKHPILIPANSEILLHIHYGPFGEVSRDSTCVDLWFEKNSSSQIRQNVPLIIPELLKDTFVISRDIKTRISDQFELPVDLKLESITPLSHLLCRSWEVFALLPDKTTISLLKIPDWDFHWKETYRFEQPILLPKGTKVFSTASYDNRADNPYNPADPPHTMDYGEHMYDENFTCFFEFVPQSNSISFLKKKFTVSTGGLSELEFFSGLEANYRIDLESFDKEQIETLLLPKTMTKGYHRIVFNPLHLKRGRYVVKLIQEGDLVDSWLFVVR